MARPPLQRSRREFLLTAGAASLAGLTGCSLSNPTIERSTAPPRAASTGSSPATGPSTGPTAVTPKPSTAPATVFTRAAAAEQGLADLAGSIRRRKGVPADQRALLRFFEQAHSEHARALAGQDPASRPTGAHSIPATRISTGKSGVTKSIRKLGAAEAKLAGSHRRAAAKAVGATAALWGSLAVAAETYAAAAEGDSPAPVEPGRHRPLPQLDDVAASQEMVRQLHAIIYGYQLAIGKLSVMSSKRRRALASLELHRRQRDQLIAWLTKRSHEVPAAEPAYVPSVVPAGSGSATRLIRRMETALLPFCGIWLAAAGSATERGRALKALRTAASTAYAWGAGVRAWPGYPD